MYDEDRGLCGKTPRSFHNRASNGGKVLYVFLSADIVKQDLITAVKSLTCTIQRNYNSRFLGTYFSI